jgi:hypothetical protein
MTDGWIFMFVMQVYIMDVHQIELYIINVLASLLSESARIWFQQIMAAIPLMLRFLTMTWMAI